MWHRPAAAAPIQPLAWVLPCAAAAALKRKKKKKKNLNGRKFFVTLLIKQRDLFPLLGQGWTLTTLMQKKSLSITLSLVLRN